MLTVYGLLKSVFISAMLVSVTLVTMYFLLVLRSNVKIFSHEICNSTYFSSKAVELNYIC